LQVREFAREERSTVYVYLDLRAAPDDAFESAVECCAYLIWTLGEESVRIRFRTQHADLMFPDQVDVYRILRELALVEADPKAEPPSFEETHPHVLFSTAGGHSAIHTQSSPPPERLVSKHPH
jgi:uncharacterized protein (DUF58 family)